MSETRTQHSIQQQTTMAKLILNRTSLIWALISDLGLTGLVQDDSVKKRVVLTNRLSVLMLMIVALSTAVFSSTTTNDQMGYLVASVAIVPIITLILNSIGAVSLGRLFFSVGTPALVLLIIVMIKYMSLSTGFQINEYHFYTPRYYLVAIAMLPLVVIDYSERELFFSALIMNVMCLYLFDFAHETLGVGYKTFGFDFKQYHQAKIMPIVLLFFLYAAIVFYQRENKKYEEKIVSLLKEVRAHNDEFVSELKLARKVVDRLVPEKAPDVAGAQVASFLQWCKEVGGDYYTIRELSDGKYLIMMADVSGKGLAASIVVSTIHSYVETRLNAGQLRIDKFVAGLNEVLCRVTDDSRFVTGWTGIYDSKTGELEGVNSGHPAPLICVPGESEPRLLDKGGTIMGFFDNTMYQFEVQKAVVPEGATLFIYTDGVTEAASPEGVLYEEDERLEKFVWENKHASPDRLIRALRDDIREFAGGQVNYDDDLTCLVLRRQG